MTLTMKILDCKGRWRQGPCSVGSGGQSEERHGPLEQAWCGFYRKQHIGLASQLRAKYSQRSSLFLEESTSSKILNIPLLDTENQTQRCDSFYVRGIDIGGCLRVLLPTVLPTRLRATWLSDILEWIQSFLSLTSLKNRTPL